MQLRRIQHWPTTPAARESLRARWEALLADADGASIFQCFDWHEAWWESFGAGHELQLLLVEDASEQLLAIAPMMLLRQRLLGIEQRQLMLIGTSNHASDYADLIVARGQSRARRLLLDSIAADRGWTTLELRNLPAGSPTATLLGEHRGLPSPLLQFAAEAPARRLGDRAADLQAANKKSLRRHLNGFVREGAVTLQPLDDIAAIERHIDAFFDQHRQRWAGTPTPSLFADPAQQLFYRGLARRLAGSGRLRFDAVCWQQRVIAYHFGFERNGVFTWYKPSFDPALHQRSPGEVLIKLLLDDALARRLDEFDFTVGSEAFKFRFANVIRQVQRLRVQRRVWQRWPTRARHWLKQAVLALRQRRAQAASGDSPSADMPPARSSCRSWASVASWLACSFTPLAFRSSARLRDLRASALPRSSIGS